MKKNKISENNKNGSFVIVPGCSDLNRGDQALLWQTKKIAEKAGFKGICSVISEQNEPIEQSKNKGINVIIPILEHPSRKFLKNNNIIYSKSLKLKWGFVALVDFLISILVLCKCTRELVYMCSSKEKKKSIDFFKNADAIFMKGGGIVHSYGGIASFYSTYFSLYHILLAIYMKKKVFIMPNSFGPYIGFGVKNLVKYIFKRVNFISVRESLSSKMALKELNLKIPIFPDLAFTLDNSFMTKEMFLSKYKIPKGKKLVALTMRPYRFPGKKDPQQKMDNFINSLVFMIKWLSQEGFFCVLVEHTLAINAHENDSACIKLVSKKLNKVSHLILSDKTLDCYDLKNIYSFFDYIIGTRFHSMIFSMSNNVPGIAITYAGNKAQGIMKDMNLSMLSISIEDIDSFKLQSKFNWLLQNEKFVRKQIEIYNKKSISSIDELTLAVKKIYES